MDPHAVLGIPDTADGATAAEAYRELAKRFHPDHRPGDGAAAARMAEINAAYALLRESAADSLRRRSSATRPHARSESPGNWLHPGVRRALGGELLRALEPDEAVVVVTAAATWESPNGRLAVSDRRLLWLRDDVPTDRVRHLRWGAVARVDGRLRRPLRRVGELVVHTHRGRRFAFSELEPAALRLVLLSARRQVGA